MQIMNTTARWGWMSKAIHWITAILIVWQLGYGVWMTNFLADPLDQFAATQVHKSWGFVVFVLAVARVIWLLVSGPRPGLPADTPHWQKRAAHASHAVLYSMIFILPLSGWVMSAASPLQDLLAIENMVFGAFAMPDPWVPGVEWVENVAHFVHFWSGILLGVVLVAHIGAALQHHFKEKDDVLKRMTVG